MPPLLERIEAEIEAAEFHQRGALAGAEFDAPVGDEIEGGDALGDPRRMVVFRRHQADAMAEADVLGALRARREEYFRRRGVRIFLEKMVLDFPGVVDAEFICEFDLIERLLEQAVLGLVIPRPRQLMLVENAEFHGRSRDVLLMPKLSSLAGFVASAFWSEYGQMQGGSHSCAPFAKT